MTLGVLWTAVACRPLVEVPLVDPLRPPEVLVESERVASDPTAVSNRFVVGWRPVRRDGRTAMAPIGAVSRIEIVTVDPRPRQLVLWGDHEGEPAPELAVAVAGETLRVGLQFPLRVGLPAPAEAGRQAVELCFPGDVPVRVRRATATGALPAGKVTIGDDGAVNQGPWSVVSVPFRAPGPGTVTGMLDVPDEADADTFFEAWIDRGGEVSTLLASWHAGDDGLESPFEAPVADGEVARLRLVAGGSGPAARWHSLVLRTRPAAVPEPPAAPRTPRLVLVFVMDALRADHVGALGGRQGLTPRLDALAREGAVFSSHSATAPSTLTSTVALFTGRPSVATGALEPAHGVTLAEQFRAAGWRTACISANPNVSEELGTTRGFEEAIRYELDRSRGFAEEINDSSGYVAEAGAAWAATLNDEDRGLLYVHTLNPHNPYAPPTPWPERFTTTSSDIAGDTLTLVGIRDGKLAPSAEDRARLAAHYAAGVAYADDRFGQLVEKLRHRFGEDEVLVVATSDHGEELLDHDGVLHGYTLYEELLRIPLVVAWPGVVDARSHESPTDQLDLHATLVELADPDADLGAGRSLWGLLTGLQRRLTRRPRFAAGSRATGEMVGIIDGRWKLVLAPRNGRTGGMGYGRGRSWDPESIFDLAADPDEHTNLAGGDRVEWSSLRARLRDWMATLAEDATAQPASVNATTRDSLRALGYVE